MPAIAYPIRTLYRLLRGMIISSFGEFANLNKTRESIKEAIRDGEDVDFGGGVP